MNRFVLDCSVSVSWFLEDETSNRGEAILARLADGEAAVPCLWPVEMAQVLVVAERQGRINATNAARVVELVLSLPICVDPGDSANLRVLWILAREHRLSAYDSSYLELAQRNGLPLVTSDQSLISASKRCGVPLFK